jgi:spore cortex biosynthesis protein YabQ
VNLEMQWSAMALMMGSGLFLGVVLDVYRALKIRLRLRGWVVSLIDVLYWAGSAVLVFALLLWSNWGQVRFYLFLAVVFGIFLYYRWFTGPVFRLIRRLIAMVEWLGNQAVRAFGVLVWQPFVSFYRAFWTFFQWILKMLRTLAVLALSPFRFLARPLRRFASGRAEPLIRRVRAVIGRSKAWWNQIRKKGGS